RVARRVLAQAAHLGARLAAPRRALAAARRRAEVRGRLDRLDRRKDERRLGRVDAQRLAEEAEGEPREDLEAHELDLAAPLRPEAVAAHLGGAGGDAQREGAPRGALDAAALAHAILDDEREGGDPPLAVRDLEADAAERAVEELGREDAAHRD